MTNVNIIEEWHDLLVQDDWKFLESCPYEHVSKYTKPVYDENGDTRYTFEYTPDQDNVSVQFGSWAYPMILSKQVFNVFEIFRFEEFINGCKL